MEKFNDTKVACRNRLKNNKLSKKTFVVDIYGDDMCPEAREQYLKNRDQKFVEEYGSSRYPYWSIKENQSIIELFSTQAYYNNLLDKVKYPKVAGLDMVITQLEELQDKHKNNKQTALKSGISDVDLLNWIACIGDALNTLSKKTESLQATDDMSAKQRIIILNALMELAGLETNTKTNKAKFISAVVDSTSANQLMKDLSANN